MSRSNPLPTWAAKMVVGVALVVFVRLLGAAQSEVGITVAVRTYVFWGLVCAPVAYLADVLARTILDYRFVQLALARVRARR